MRKPDFCICENKGADQLRGDREADQHLCFRYTDITIPRLPKYKISSLKPSSVAVQPGLCQTRSEILKTGFLTTRLVFHHCLLFHLHVMDALLFGKTTVKPVLGDHRWEGPNVVSQGRWSLRPGNQDN